MLETFCTKLKSNITVTRRQKGYAPEKKKEEKCVERNTCDSGIYNTWNIYLYMSVRSAHAHSVYLPLLSYLYYIYIIHSSTDQIKKIQENDSLQ